VNGTPAEVNYYPGQYLTANLFRAEQAYHVTMRERHNLTGHDWGVALGLGLSAAQAGTGYVDAGYAIDGYGRELILPARTQFLLSTAFDELGADSLDVYLVYGVAPSGDYTVEKPAITLDRALGPGADRRQPQVAAGDGNFDATGTAPHDTLHPWPVYLGTITRDPTAPASAPVISGAPVYVGARAAQVLTPSGDAHLDLGQDVVVAAAGQESPALHWKHGDAGPGQLEVGGALAVGGDLAVNGGRVLVAEAADTSTPGWQLDHVSTVTDAGTGATVEQLRLVLGDPASGNTAEFVIGCFSNGQFTPCLTVAADGTVTVHGNLIVAGMAHLNGTVLS
jgi:hypothetical protein